MEEITLVEIQPLHVLSIRRRGHFRLIPELFVQIFEFAMKNQVTIAGMPMFLLHEVSKEDALEADKAGTADVEVAVPVSGKVRAGGNIQSYTLPGGKMARTIHKGPYEACELTYQGLLAWIEARGLRVKGPIREIYHNDPREVKPEDIITEILVPVG